ncbi:PAS domain-containing protein [Rosenbergiella epipactidis]|uniref:helix-turn-helix transcriptional regulator n=1 Tax=Rosenbergiella epipactidis TaxID=1544694 RepID=UPI002026FEED|nr:PAS domain-containing protein [Rosenbergiella epipactidis]MCL9667751.1 PAS domain-containing protein [Rosenbergiella epipactidis]
MVLLINKMFNKGQYMNVSEQESYTEDMITMLSATVRALGSVLAGNAEIVLHDLRNPIFSIAEIANASVTGRKKGDSVLAGMRTDRAFISAMENKKESVSLLLDYETFTRDGKSLRSSTALYRDRTGMPYAALCINVDNSGIDEALRVLQSLAGTRTDVIPAIQEEASSEASHDNIEDLMRDIIGTTTALSSSSSRADTKRANLLAVKNMQEKGIFLIKGGVEKAAAALGVSRYTIYNYLDELKTGDE